MGSRWKKVDGGINPVNSKSALGLGWRNRGGWSFMSNQN